MQDMITDAFERALGVVREYGLLLVSDPQLPCVAAIVAGEPVRGSWWGHPRGGDIYQVCLLLDAHAELSDAKLISSKVTYVHQRLWPALAAVGSAREPWQTAGLSPLATRLLTLLLEVGVVQTDDVNELEAPSRKALGDAAHELENTLLAHGESVHTSAGAHAKRLETWPHWATRLAMRQPWPSAGAGKALLAAAWARLHSEFSGRGRLPWSVG
jgi:hypothetical protein